MESADGLRVGHGVTIPLAEVQLRTSRSSGPGGQHANVTDSRVEASFEVAASQTLSEAQRARVLDALGPRVTALERLRAKLEEALRVRRPRRATAPSAAARERRLSAKRVGAERKQARRPPQDDD
jgi:ribosome-associated protein